MSRVLITVDDAEASATIEGVLTSGAVGIPVEVTITGDRWAGLTPLLVCKADGKAYGIVLEEGRSVVPHECLNAGVPISFGVDGRAEDGSLRIPTMWTESTLVLGSPADIDHLPPSPPTPEIVDQILAAADRAVTTASGASVEAKKAATAATAAIDGVNGILQYGHPEVPARDWDFRYIRDTDGSVQRPGAAFARLCTVAYMPMEAGDYLLVSSDVSFRVAFYDANTKAFLYSIPSTGFIPGNGLYQLPGDGSYFIRVTLTYPDLNRPFESLDDGDLLCEFVPYSYLRVALEVLKSRVKDLEESGGGAVESVNGKTGKIQLQADDVGAYSKAETDTKLDKKANTKDIPTIPDALPNPKALTFTGGAEGRYDGSRPVSVNIPKAYDDKEVQGALTEIKDDLTQLDNTKVGYSEVVNGQILMFSDSTKAYLLATLDLPSGGGAVDWHEIYADETDFVEQGEYMRYRIVPPDGYRISELTFVYQIAKDKAGSGSSGFCVGMHDTASDATYHVINQSINASLLYGFWGGTIKCLNDYESTFSGSGGTSATGGASLPSTGYNASGLNRTVYCNVRPSRVISFNIAASWGMQRAYLHAKYRLEKAE